VKEKFFYCHGGKSIHPFKFSLISSLVSKMLSKWMRTSRYMKVSGCNDAAVVDFIGKVQRIPSVHLYGLKDTSAPRVIKIQYSY